jgi:malate dehydrogenase (oxaloacetate-decarboxylating)(NADP+)
MLERKGVTEQYAKLEMRRRHTLIGSMMIHFGEADGMVCGTFGSHSLHLHYVDQILGRQPGINTYAAMNLLMLPNRSVALVDTHVNPDPTAEEIAEITLMAADEMRRIGLEPRVALLSHSNFGGSNEASAAKMREALGMIRERRPELNIDGEMHGDVALDAELRKAIMPRSTLVGEANLLVMPTIDAANISYNLLKVAAGHGIAIGPILLGCKGSVAILTSSATVRRIVNMTALTVLDANAKK